MVQYGYGLYVELRFLRRIHLSYQYETNHGWSQKGENAIVVAPTSRAKTTTILGAISTAVIIRICLRTPQAPKKKRELGQGKALTTGTVKATISAS